MCPYIKEHSPGLPRRLGRLRGGPHLHLRHPGDALNLRLLLLHCSALKPPLLQSFLRPRSGRQIPRRSVGFSEVGVCPLAQHRRLSGPLLASMEGSGSGCLGRGGLVRGIQDPLLQTTSVVRPTPPHTILFSIFPQGKSLGAGVPRSTPQASSRLLQSPICGPEGFRGVAPHHRPIHPEHLHRYGIRMLRYLDDWLILAESRTTCLQVRDRLLQVCEELGLQVNLRKSSLIPSQDMTYLGMQIQSVRFIAKPTETRVANLLKIIEEFLSSPDPPAALWRRLLGHLSSLTLLVKGGMLRMRSLQIRLRSRCDFRDELLRIPWDLLCQEDLLWWSWAIQRREGVDLSLPVPDLSFYSDASDVGWGAIVGEHQVSGVWAPCQRGFSINLREMMAVQKGLLEFSSLLRGKTIALFCDNVTTVAYLRRLGGTKSHVLFL